jgi:nitroreductase
MKSQSSVIMRSQLALLMLLAGSVLALSCAGTGKNVTLAGAQIQAIRLPPPQMEGGMPLMTALKNRKSERSFSEEKLPSQVLSNLLWAGFGVNRPESGRRTAPSAMNWQEVDIYAAMEEGLYLYNAAGNTLEPVSPRDLRPETGGFAQPFVKSVPVDLIFVADFSRAGVTGKLLTSEDDRLVAAAACVGCIAQNIYLFCASEGLSTVVRAYFDRAELSKAMGLRDSQRIILVQPVGYPKK